MQLQKFIKQMTIMTLICSGVRGFSPSWAFLFSSQSPILDPDEEKMPSSCSGLEQVFGSIRILFLLALVAAPNDVAPPVPVAPPVTLVFKGVASGKVTLWISSTKFVVEFLSALEFEEEISKTCWDFIGFRVGGMEAVLVRWGADIFWSV